MASIADTVRTSARESPPASSPIEGEVLIPHPDPEKAKRGEGLTEKKIVDQIVRLKGEAETRMKYVMDTMLACYDQYRNKYDFTDKEAWQSRITIAKAHAAVKHATANIMKLIVQNQPITVEDATQETAFRVFFGQDVERTILRLWEVAKYREVLRDALEGGFSCGMGAVKVGWFYDPRNFTTIGEEEGQRAFITETVLEGKLALNSIDPWRLWFGPKTGQFGKVDWVIEEMNIDVPALAEMGFGTEDLRKEDFSQDESKTKERHRLDLETKQEHVCKEARVWEFRGDLIDEQDQQIIARDVQIFVGNQQHILALEGQKIRKVPFWDRKRGYIIFSPLNVAFRFPGQGILETSHAVKDAIDEIAQMSVDHLKFSLLNMYEVDAGQLENPSDLSTGVEPGKFFRKRLGTAGTQVIRPIEHMPLGADPFNAMLGFDHEYQRGTFITEQTQGLLDVKGETTATEVQTTALQSTLMLSDIALHIEDTLLAPLAEFTWDRAFQYLDSTSNPTWTSLLGPVRGEFLDNLPREQRMSIIQGDYHFVARGLSRAIERQQNLQKLINFMQVVGQNQIFAPFLNMPDIFRRIFESFHFEEPWKMLAPNAEQLLYAMQAGLLVQNNPAIQGTLDTAQRVAETEAKTQGAIDTANVQAENQAVGKLLEQMMQGAFANANPESKSAGQE